MALEPRKRKPLVITDKDGNVIDLLGKRTLETQAQLYEEWDFKQEAEEPPQIITFEVSGQIFKVSRSVLDKYPDSMLANRAYGATSNDPDSPIFIDGDGERFRYCLDYLRHGRAYLPWTVSKDGILHDLEYYGIENVNADAIDESSASLTAAAQMFKVESEYEKEMGEYEAQIAEIERMKRHAMVAFACFKKFSQTGSLTEITFDPDAPQQSKQVSNVSKKRQNASYDDACSVFQFFDEEFFNKCLGKYGLYHIRNELYRPPGSSIYGYQVSLGKVADRQDQAFST